MIVAEGLGTLMDYPLSCSSVHPEAGRCQGQGRHLQLRRARHLAAPLPQPACGQIQAASQACLHCL